MVVPGGRVVLMGWSREHIETMWMNAYFPSARAWLEEIHEPLAAYLDVLPGATVEPLFYTDRADGSSRGSSRSGVSAQLCGEILRLLRQCRP